MRRRGRERATPMAPRRLTAFSRNGSSASAESSLVKALLCLGLLLPTLLSLANAKDGPQILFEARQTAQAIDAYMDSVAKTGGRPVYNVPPVSGLVRNLFDADRLPALAATGSADLPW